MYYYENKPGKEQGYTTPIPVQTWAALLYLAVKFHVPLSPDCYSSWFSPHPHTQHLNCRPWSEQLVILVYFWLLFFIITDHVLGRFDSRIYIHARNNVISLLSPDTVVTFPWYCARDSVQLRIAYRALVPLYRIVDQIRPQWGSIVWVSVLATWYYFKRGRATCT